MKRILISVALVLVSQLAAAQTQAPAGRQNVAALRTVAEQFLKTETA
ncbi:MAG: flagellar basal body P-ring formation protein FlgA, partial [Oxalobacteraceae bacterium]